MSYLLDTTIVSEAKRPRRDENVLRWLSAQSLTSTYLSAITPGELEEGVTLLGDTQRAGALRAWLASLTAAHTRRILAVDEAVVSIWGRLRAEAKREGRPAPVMGTLIAATAITHHLTFVTHNPGGVAALPVKTLSPSEVGP